MKKKKEKKRIYILIIAIIGFVFSFINVLGLILSIVALILSLINIKRKDGYVITGLIISIISIILFIIMTIFATSTILKTFDKAKYNLYKNYAEYNLPHSVENLVEEGKLTIDQDTYVITLKEINNYSNIYTSLLKDCDGYVMVLNKTDYKGYLKCSNIYVTEEYNSAYVSNNN